jgi:ubiquinone/menaquinone biosynthesis C-methylase UbiE
VQKAPPTTTNGESIMSTPAVPPVTILRHAYGYWASAILAASLRHDLFTHLEVGRASAEQLAGRAGLTERTTQAMLDALLGMELVTRVPDGYENSLEASTYLVRGKRDYLGGYADLILSTWRDWERLPEVVASGKPLHRHEEAKPDNPFWESYVLGLAPLSFAPARMAAEHLKLRDKPSFRMLDIAGGAGAFSATWLELHPEGRSLQVDLANVNVIARKYVATFGVADRFETLDGDMERLELGQTTYDYAIYANIAHGLSAERNIAMFRKIRRALKPGGTLVIMGLLPNDDRTGDPLLLRFNVNMILNTLEGATHLRTEYRDWLAAGGFEHVDFQSFPDVPFTLVYAS